MHFLMVHRAFVWDSRTAAQGVPLPEWNDADVGSEVLAPPLGMYRGAPLESGRVGKKRLELSETVFSLSDYIKYCTMFS